MFRIGILGSMTAILLAATLAQGDEITIAHDPGGSVVESKEEPLTYALRVTTPWADGGYIVLNLPEHFGFSFGDHGILHYNDKGPNKWTVEADKKSASLHVESPYTEGLWINGEVKVSDEHTLRLTMQLDNQTTHVIQDVDALFCVHYRLLTGFPSWNQGFPQTYVPVGGKMTSLADLPTKEPKAAVKFANIQGSGVVRTSSFAKRFGGIVEQRLDFPLSVVTDKEGKRKIALQWLPAGVMLSNSNIPCVHCDPVFANIPPGEKREAHGTIVFTEEPLEAISTRFKAQAATQPTTMPSTRMAPKTDGKAVVAPEAPVRP